MSGFTTATVRLGARRVVVARPNDRQYGHLGLEIGMAFAYARACGADVYLVKPRGPLGSGFFELESPDVRVLRPAAILKELLQACLSFRALRERVDILREDIRDQVEREFMLEASRYLDDPGLPQPVRDRLRRTRRRLKGEVDQMAWGRRTQPPYYRRQLLRDPVPVRLRPSAAADAARQAHAHGIAADARLVCIHAREPGYKRGAEIHDTKPDAGRDDGTRNARIETYLDAVDLLVRRGYTIVRLGDPSMTPLRHPGVVDLATSPARSNLLETYCLLRAALLIAGESGLAGVTYLTNTPFLRVNSTEPISAYPIRAPGLFLMKTVIDRPSGQPLRQLDLLGSDYCSHFRDTRRYHYIDNTPGQIREATSEMLDWIDGAWAESPGQRAYHDAAVTAAAQLRHESYYLRKWGLDDGFLGDGRIARVAIEAP